MFLSMVDVPGENNGPLRLRSEEGHDDMFKKRFNVAASRARDQMWVVHSFDADIDLKDGDIRKRLILHARNPDAVRRQIDEQEQRVESEFEKQVFRRLIAAGYRVKTQWPVGAYRIDMVVEGKGKRLAVECDGDRWHTPDKLEADMARQAILERLGWRFVRIRGSLFFRDPDQAMEVVFSRLRALEIPPEGFTTTEDAQNHDGKELKERIIRQADELRQQWKERERESVGQLLVV
jgi:very-short-patch-repair endonuclease